MDTINDLIFDDICEEAFPILDELRQDGDCLVKGTNTLDNSVAIEYLLDDININRDIAQRVLDAYPLNQRREQ